MNQLIIHLMPADGCAMCGKDGKVLVRRMDQFPPGRMEIPCPLCQGPDELVAFLKPEAGAA